MSRPPKDTTMGRKTKLSFLNDLSIADTDNFEPPQLSSTPFKIIHKSKKKLKDNNRLNPRLNLSLMHKKDQSKKGNIEINNLQLKSMSPIIKKNFKYDRVSELFSDPKEFIETDSNAMVNNSDDEWTTFSDVSEDKTHGNVFGLLDEIEANVESRFEKPPRRSYLGRKRNMSNRSLYQDEYGKENEETEINIEKKDRKHKQKKYSDPQDEVLIQSMNEHFSDVESFSLTVE